MSDLQNIEREAAAERQEFAKSLDALSRSVDPDNIKDHATALIEQYGGDLGRNTWDAARKNPAAFALVGAGLTLLLSGTGSRPETRAPRPVAVPPEKALVGFDERVAAADATIKQEMTGMSYSDPDTNQPRAAWLRSKIEDGLDSLPPAARSRVRKARHAAIDAQDRVETQARVVAEKSRSAINNQPLAVGAVALGIGAIIGTLLPSTRREDALLGEHRDSLMAVAKSTLRDELDQVHAAAKSGLRGTD